MIKGFLFDLDGVFYVSNKLISGANDTINWVRSKNIPYKFLTNTTTLSRDGITRKLQNLGLQINKEDVISANYAGSLYLKKQQPKSCKLILNDIAKDDYAEFTITKKNPEFIILGDVGNTWSYALMNELLNDVLNGSKMIALHKGRYFQTDDGLKIDAGAFITGIEYATQLKAISIGKPSEPFFQLAINNLGVPSKNICMVGDDLYNDIEAANQFGLHSALVKTGKYRSNIFEKSNIIPNFIFDSIATLPSELKTYIS